MEDIVATECMDTRRVAVRSSAWLDRSCAMKIIGCSCAEKASRSSYERGVDPKEPQSDDSNKPAANDEIRQDDNRAADRAEQSANGSAP